MVNLVPISDEAFKRFRRQSILDYAEMQAAAGIWPRSDALELSEKEIDRLLPDGPATRNHFVFDVERAETGETVGLVWFALIERNGAREVYVYDIQIDESNRGRGYGSAAMRVLEEKARELGAAVVRLRVHAHNRRAHALYRRLGYAETDIMMARALSVGEGA